MAATVDWVDLLDPHAAALADAAPTTLHPRALEQLVAPAAEPPARPTLEAHGEYVFGVLLAPVAVQAEDRIFYQEVDVLLGRDWLVTVRKTPPGEEAFDLAGVRRTCSTRERSAPGRVAYHLVDEIAERYLALVDALEDEIDELEDQIEDLPPVRVRRRLSELRQDVLRIRRMLGPTREVVRSVIDGRVDLEGEELFDRAVELDFRDAYEKLLRANEGLEYARELVASARDFHQSKIAEEQNDVIRKLTVIASLLLLPTFIVGVYGQNFEHMPELGWRLGYLFSWGVIVVSTLALLAFFRWRRWI